MKNFLKYTLASFTGILIFSLIAFLLFFGIIGIISSASKNKSVTIKPGSILYMKLDREIIDRATENPLENFDFQTLEGNPRLGLNQILKNIEKAAKDDNIEGILLDLIYIPAGFATIEEIRDALIDFKESGKFIYTYSDVMTQSAYYVASVSDKIYLNPVGELELKGLRSKHVFLKGTFEKLGIEPVIFRHGKFKSAVEPFILDKMSKANKEQTITYVQSIWDHLASGIAEQRGISLDKVNQIADEFAISNPADAVEYGIIDGIRYRDEVSDELVELTNAGKPEKLKFVNLTNYNNVSIEKKGKPERNKIAIVYAQGGIDLGKNGTDNIGSETISKAIRKARRDSTVKAIVFRINSPGGSALASDIIWREAVLAQKEKPFIVSMGDMAASGGYYVSCPADTIVASEVTITGSIGVFGMMFNTQKFMNKKLGVTFDGVKTNKYADLPDLTRPMTEAEKEIIQRSVEEVYDVFISHVAEGRDMTKDGVDEIGQGRVWSGANAKEIGLVDVFGGLNTAVDIAVEKAGVEKYRIVEYPVQPDPMEEFLKQLTGDVKMNFIKNELGESYTAYKQYESVKKMQGVQARLPFDVELY